MILVVEGSSKFPKDNTYTLMALCGTVYTESEFRGWVADVWKVDPSLPLKELADVAKRGGWRCFHQLT